MRNKNEWIRAYSQIATTGTIGLFNNFLSYIFLFICTIFLLEGDYGVLVVILSSISTFSSIIDLGVGGSVSRTIASISNTSAINRSINVGFLLEILFFCITFPIIFLILQRIVPSNIMILALIFLNCIQLYLFKVFFGLRKAEIANFLMFLYNMLKIILALIVFFIYPEINSIINVLLFDYIIIIVMGIYFLKDRLGFIFPNKSDLKEILGINFVIWQGAINFQLFSNMPVILIGFYISSKNIITEFSYAYTLASIGWIMMAVMSSAFVPFLMAKNESERRFVILLLLVSSLELFYIAIVQLGSSVIYDLTGLPLFGSFQNLNMILFGLVPYSLLSVRKFMLVAERKTKILYSINIVEMFLLTFIPLVLIGFNGVIGAVLTFFVSSILTHIFIMICFSKEVIIDVLMIIFSIIFCSSFISFTYFIYLSWIMLFPFLLLIWKFKGIKLWELTLILSKKTHSL